MIDVNEKEIPTDFKQVLKLGLQFIFKPSEAQLMFYAKKLERTKYQQKKQVVNRFRRQWKSLKDKYMVLPTDKNMGCSIISIKQFQILKNDILDDSTTFKLLENESIENIVENFNKSITKILPDICYYMKPDPNLTQPLPIFRGIPKVHKTPVKLRPIVDCSNVITTKLSKILHATLWEVVLNAKGANQWMVENTDEFTERLDHITKDDAISLKIHTADIKSLYTSIPIASLLNNLSFMINSYRSNTLVKLEKPDNRVIQLTNYQIIQMVEIYIEFNFCLDKNGTPRIFKQIKGIPTGGNCSPDLANIFLMAYEIQFRTFHESLWISIKFTGRYLDDLITLTNDEKFTWEVIQKDVFQNQIELEDNSKEGFKSGIFLDIEVEINQNEGVVYQLYRKPGNAYQYIHKKSYIAEHIKKNFIQHETLRIQKRCKRHTDFVKHLRYFKNKLQERGYSKEYIKKLTTKSALEGYKSKPKKQSLIFDGRPWRVVPYNTHIPEEKRKEYIIIPSNQMKIRELLK